MRSPALHKRSRVACSLKGRLTSHCRRSTGHIYNDYVLSIPMIYYRCIEKQSYTTITAYNNKFYSNIVILDFEYDEETIALVLLRCVCNINGPNYLHHNLKDADFSPSGIHIFLISQNNYSCEIVRSGTCRIGMCLVTKFFMRTEVN